MAKNALVSFSGQFQAVAVALSSRLDKRGVSIVEAISQLAQSGSEKALDKIADILASLLAMFSNLVNYDKPRWETFEGSYTYVNPDLKPEHFPIQGKGQAMVAYDYIVFDHEPTTQEVLDTIERRSDVRRPDRAETEDFLDAHPEEQRKYPVVGLCGSVVGLDGYRNVACVVAYESGRDLNFYRLDIQWYQRCRFLVVRK